MSGGQFLVVEGVKVPFDQGVYDRVVAGLLDGLAEGWEVSTLVFDGRVLPFAHGPGDDDFKAAAYRAAFGCDAPPVVLDEWELEGSSRAD